MRRRFALLVGLTLAVTAVAAAVWMSRRSGGGDGFETCEVPADCADVLHESGVRPLVPRANDRFAFVSGDVSRSDARPLGTMVLQYELGSEASLQLLVTNTSQEGVAQQPPTDELTTTPGGRRVRATDRFVSHWANGYLYTVISPLHELVPTDALLLIDLLE